MSDAWKSYRGAPDPGVSLCQIDEIPDPGTHCLLIDGFPLLLVRQDMVIAAFVNACPHQYLPLNHKGDRMLSSDGHVLRCTNHAAGFDSRSGQGVEGLGLGSCLDPVPVEVVDGIVQIAMR